MKTALAADPRTFRYRMKDLCDLTGLPRQAIHFYIQQGLLPSGRKTGRNMAYYSEQHVARLKLIRQLQHERFLPLKAIRALLNDQSEEFTPEQSQVLASVKERLARALGVRAEQPGTVDADRELQRLGVARADLERMIELDMIVAKRDSDGKRVLSKDDIWLLELLAELRHIGFTAELGFEVGDLAIYEEVISTLFDHEKELLKTRLASLSPDLVASMIERSISVIHAFLIRYHESKIRNFVAAL